MTHKVRYISLGVLGLLLAVSAIIFFLHRKNTYMSSLPEQMQAVAVLDVRKLGQKHVFVPSAEQQTFLENSGLDLEKQIFAFVDEENATGVLLPLASRKRWESLLRERGLSVESQRGMYWTRWSNWLLAFSDDRCLAYGPLSEQEMDRTRGKMAGLMRQNEKADNRLLQQMGQDNDAPLSVAFSANLARHLVTRFVPEMVDACSGQWDGDVFVNLKPQGKTLLLDAELVCPNAEASTSFLLPLGRNAVAKLSPDHLASLSVGVDGELLLKNLRKLPRLRTQLLALNMCIDADMMIRSLRGALTLGIPRTGDALSGSLLKAQLSDTRFLQNSSDWGQGFAQGLGMNLTSLSDSCFSLSALGQTFCFGVSQGTLVASTDRHTFQEACREVERNPDNIVDDAEGAVLYAQVSLPALADNAGFFFLLMDKQFSSVMESFKQFDTLTLRVRRTAAKLSDEKD